MNGTGAKRPHVSALLRHSGLLILLLLALTAGCSPSGHGDPKNPKKTPHPVKRYEVTATVEAPGPWDSVKGYLSFDVVNVDCVPQDSFTGARNVPTSDSDFETTHVDENTWKGYFYRDLLQDEDYFGLGVCHWDVTQASPAFTVHGENFAPGSGLENVEPYTEYFKKIEFLDRSFTGRGALVSSANNSSVVQHLDAFFPITVTIKEVIP